MSSLFLYFFLLFSGGSESNTLPQDAQYTLSGKIFVNSQYHGGANIPRDNQTVPWHGCKLKVVRVDDVKSVPVVVGTVRADVNGRFSIKLPPGKYGFIEEDESPQKDHYSPRTQDDRKDGYRFTSNWDSVIHLPVEIKNKNVTGVYLTNYSHQYCMTCP